jgi:O-antigen/teichoic acid export membrane protein
MGDIKKTSLKKNFIYNMIYEVLVLSVPLITIPYISRVLGSENVGIYNYVSANVTYFSLIAAFGSASYAQREIAFIRDDREVRTREFWGVFSFRIISSLAALIFFGAFCVIVPDYKIFYIVSGISIVSVLADVSWFFQGLENFKVTVIRNVFIKLSATALIFAFVKKPEDLLLYIAINVGSVFIGSCSLWVYLKDYIDSFSRKYINIKKHLFGSLKLFIPVLAIQVYTVVDKTMLGVLVNVAEVGYFSQAEKIVQIIISVINALAIVLLPRISALIADNNFAEANLFYKKSVRAASLLAIPCMIGCVFVAEDFIPFFLGEHFEPSVRVLQILSLLFVILGMARVIGTPLLIPLKRENKYTIAVCSGAVINVLLNLFLIPRYAAAGAAVATIAAEACVTLLELYFVRDCFEPQVVIKSLWQYTGPGLVMTLILVMCHIFAPAGIIRMTFSVALGAATYFAVLIMKQDDLVKDMVLKPLRKIFRPRFIH